MMNQNQNNGNNPKDIYTYNQRGDCMSSGRMEWNPFYQCYTIVDTTQNMGIRYKNNK